ncbi:MAG: hypothetical protein ACRDJE_25845 [Dehalococcoidia bacterium]
MQTTRARTAGQAGIAWVSDGWAPYAETIAESYWERVPVTTAGRAWTVLRQPPELRLTQVIKHRQGRRLVGVAVQATIGTAVAQPHPVCVERRNGVLRDRLACLTRKTHAFAKETATWDAALSLALFEQNWLRPHPALRHPLPAPSGRRRYLRRTPAMALGLADQPWTWLDFLTRPLPHYLRG